MTETRFRVALVAAAVATVAAGALVASEATTRARAPVTVVAAVPKTDRLDVAGLAGTAGKIDAAFALLDGSPKPDFRIATSSPAAQDCLPACSSIVFKSAGPDMPSRIVPGAAVP